MQCGGRVEGQDVDLAFSGVAHLVMDVGAYDADVAGDFGGVVGAVVVADGAQRQLVDGRCQVTAERDGVGAAAADGESQAVPVGTVARADGQGFSTVRDQVACRIVELDHHGLQVAVLVGDGGICGDDLDGWVVFDEVGGVDQPVGFTVGVYHRGPDGVDGGGGTGGGSAATGDGAVGDGDGDGARADTGVGVGVLVGDGRNDGLVFARCARTADADAGGAAAGDGDRATQFTGDAGLTRVGECFVGGAKEVVQGTGGELYAGAGNALGAGKVRGPGKACGGGSCGDVNVSDADAGGVGNGNACVAAGQEAGGVVDAAGVGVEVQHGGVVDVGDGDAHCVAVVRVRCGAATGADIGGVACCAAVLVPGVVVKADGLAVLLVGHKTHHVGALEQQGIRFGDCAKVGPFAVGGVELVLPLAAAAGAGDGGAVDGNALGAAVDVGHIGQQLGDGLAGVAGGVFVDAGHVAACAAQDRGVVGRCHRDVGSAGGAGQDFGAAGVAADRQVVAGYGAGGFVPGVVGDAAGHRAAVVGIGHKADAVAGVQQQGFAAVGGEVKGGPASSTYLVLPGAVGVVCRRDGDGLGHVAAQVGVGDAAVGDQAGHGVARVIHVGHVFGDGGQGHCD